jgi:hypothetical protein
VSKGNYRYPADEFDAAADRDGPRGVHRAPRSAWRKAWPFLVIVVLFPALAYGLVTWMSDSGGKLISDFGSSQPANAVTDAPTDAATGVVPAAPTPGATDTSPPPAVASSAPPAAPAPVLTTPVSVLNAANVTGAAAAEAKKLTAGGFTRVTAANGSGAGVTTTTVFYATAAQKTTADAVAQLLGITTVTKSSTRAPGGITVVLTPGYPR